MAAEIPVWVGGLQKWITGLTKKTTCEDIVRALLRSEGRPAVEEKDWNHYVIVERWRKVERPLDAKSKILKVWKTWGEEQSNVRFTLKRMPAVTPKDVKTLRKRPKSKLWRQEVTKTTTTLHPRKLLQQQQQQRHHHHHHHQQTDHDIDGRITETMERLMKVIIAQGETIQAQLRRLQDKDEQIDCFEQQMHFMRMEEMGANYLLDTYLGDSGHSQLTQQQHQIAIREGPAVAIPSTSTPNSSSPEHNREREFECMDGHDGIDITLRDLRRCARYYERLAAVSERLEKEEEVIDWLTLQVSLWQSDAKEGSSGGAEEIEGGGGGGPDDPAAVAMQLEIIRGSVQRLEVINAGKDQEIKENELALADLSRLVQDKSCYVTLLEQDLSATDEEGEALRVQHENFLHCKTTMSVTPDGGLAIKVKDHSNDNDSNSDTGLSSLHSSSDDGVYALDTLV